MTAAIFTEQSEMTAPRRFRWPSDFDNEQSPRFMTTEEGLEALRPFAHELVDRIPCSMHF